MRFYNARSIEVHRANQMRVWQEREQMATRFGFRLTPPAHHVIGPIVVTMQKPKAAKVKVHLAAGLSEIPKGSVSRRACLSCQETFRSFGLANRLCSRCRRRPEGFMGL